jgi:hypothetical protein
MWHWIQLLWWPETGQGYAFTSSIGSDLGELAIFGAIYGAWRKHSCHTPHCWRIGRHIVNGTPWCNKHHERARKDAGQ